MYAVTPSPPSRGQPSASILPLPLVISLKSLGGATVPVAAHDPKADQAELDAYDKKVYRRLMDMTADFDRQLRGLQVPFFAIKHDLVILDDGRQTESEAKGKIDKGELRELQKKMTETLEDLLGDE